MAVKVVPAVLGRTAKEYRQRLTLAETLATTIHLDVMDGAFVRSTSVRWSTIKQNPPHHRCEIHAMVRQVDQLVPMIAALHPHRVYLHVELPATAVTPFIAFLRSRRIAVGLAINPTTRLDRLEPYTRHASAIMVMGVRPGQYGARWQPKTLQRLRAVRRRWPRLRRVCDGGVSERTIAQVIIAGAQEVIIGSAVMLATDPKATWRRLRSMTR
jgi:ribulose-phosphate 3-epimerase